MQLNEYVMLGSKLVPLLKAQVLYLFKKWYKFNAYHVLLSDVCLYKQVYDVSYT